jgi:hypothetical protein
MSPPVAPVMTEALVWARKRKFPLERPTRFQLKIADVSYYPHKGTIFVDGEDQRRPETGLGALEKLLITKRLIRDPRETEMEVYSLTDVE